MTKKMKMMMMMTSKRMKKKAEKKADTYVDISKDILFLSVVLKAYALNILFYCEDLLLLWMAWTMQALALTCLSMAAKIDETQAPMPIDLKVENLLFHAWYICLCLAAERTMEETAMNEISFKSHQILRLVSTCH
ncbi:hypothetical protein RIF29_15235 [Crotalaria pallida]|uniref:Uncharacterized protein n=1 Tax=Crotalaria pallida TaxID=3830 RepID=A0AAN9FLF0_CROPI